MIRIREEGLPKVNDCIIIPVKKQNIQSMNEALTKLFSYITSDGIPETPDIDFERDLQFFISQKYLSKKINSLASRFPELLVDYDPSLNDNLSPYNIAAFSNNPVNWRCNICHSIWSAIVSSRTLGGNGCAVCSGHRVVSGKNDLEYKRPDVAKLWDYEKNKSLTPRDITCGNPDKHWWKCPFCGESWEAVTYSLTRPGSSLRCEKCSKKYAGANRRKNYVESGHSIEDTHPWVAKQWHPTKNGELKPRDISIGYDKPIYWICCDCGETFESIPYVVKKKKSMTCKSCSTKRAHSRPNSKL